MNELPTIINQIQQLIARGKTEQAVELLIELTFTAHKEFYETALLLKNRIKTLDKDVIEGVLNHSEQNIERLKISKSLLSLTSSIEEGALKTIVPISTPSVSEPIMPTPQMPPSLFWNKRKVWVTAFLGVTLLTLIAYFSWDKKGATTVSPTAFAPVIPAPIAPPPVVKPDNFDLIVQVITDTDNNALLNTDFLKINFGNEPLPEAFIQKGKFIYKGIPKSRWENPLTVEVLNPDYDISDKKGAIVKTETSKTVTFKIIPKKIVFSGHIQFPNKQTVPNSILEINYQNNNFQTTTDNNGQFQIELPASSVNKLINLTIRYKGKAVINQNIMVNEAILKYLTIPNNYAN